MTLIMKQMVEHMPDPGSYAPVTLVSSLHHLKMDLNLGAVGRRTLGRKRPAGSVGRRAH
jgi:hypothetical protein